MKTQLLFFCSCIEFLLCLFASRLYAQPDQVTEPRLTGLKTEYLSSPMGIDHPHPRFTWRLESLGSGDAQASYLFRLDPDSLAVDEGRKGLRFEATGRDPNHLITYTGEPLQAFTRYYWQVQVTMGDGRTITSDVASFEMGMLQVSDWKGAWISDVQDVNLRAAGQFRKEIRVSKKIRSARAYIAAAGLYELAINGHRIGDHRLDPMYTRFDRRILYVTYDVTTHLKAGNNALGVMLGNGWYNHQSTAVWNFHQAPWRARPAFCMDLRITYEDGTVETITTGKDWKTATGPVVFNSIYTAEHYDARLEQPGWTAPDFDETGWKPVLLRSAPTSNIRAQVLHPVRSVREIDAVRMQQMADTLYVYDFGQNMSGVTALTARGEAGTVIRLRHGEQLYPDGRVDLSNIDVHYRPVDDSDPFQTDVFVLSGRGEETFMPRFNYKGFQYVEVSSDRPVHLTAASLKAHFMHSHVPIAGRIRSSNPTLDKIWQATNQAYLSNLFGYPTDCPQREKNGWTGDAHIAVETGLYSFDAITIYEKWLADHRDEQQPNGVLPSIIPTGGWGYEWGNGPDWTSTIAIIPWNIYLFYGDPRLLEDCYDNIRRYVDYIDHRYPSGLTSWGLGDWVPVKSKSPVELTSTAYYYADVVILSKAARLLGRNADQRRYEALATKIREAFNAKYFDPASKLYGTGLQTEMSVPLYWGLVPDEHRQAVADGLSRRVQADGLQLDVGLLGTKAILNALSDHGHADLAYHLAARETYPSWGWWIVNGATTLYENWDIHAQSDLSRNHIMFGEIGAWLYKGLGGIKPDEVAPGFENIRLEPNFPQGLEVFEAEHLGPRGWIRSSWQRSDRGIQYTVVVPANSGATLRLPASVAGKQVLDAGGRLLVASEAIRIGSGTHTFFISF